MLLDGKTSAQHNAMQGRKIQHSPDMPPTKRLKTIESTDVDEEDSYNLSVDEGISLTPIRVDNGISESDADSGEDERPPPRPTALESALPLVKTDKEAIAEYEAMKTAEQNNPGGLQDRLEKRSWTRGKCSIYVDAFNLALETVLEDERHLFNEKEIDVFKHWTGLEYEAQYL